jgi:PAS domain S-box-containing protein
MKASIRPTDEVRKEVHAHMDSEEQLLQVFRNCPVALAVHRWADRRFVDVNAAFTELLGWTHAEVLGRTTQELHIAEGDASAAMRAALTETHSARDHELTVRARDGEIRQVIVASQLIEMRGEPHVITTFVDITARKQVEIAASRLAAIISSSDDAIFGEDLDGIITSWNAGAERIYGYRAGEIVGTSVMRLIPDELKFEVGEILKCVRKDGVSHLETTRVTSDGRRLDMSITTSPIRDASGALIGVSKVGRDISARKQAERERVDADARYRALFEYAPDGILIADANSNYIDANASICAMLGYSHDELVGLHASDIVAPAEARHVAPALSIITTGGEYSREWQFRRKDGSLFPAEVIAALMPDGNLLGMVRDITERKRAEARFRRLADSNAQGVMFWSLEGRIIGANDAFLRIVGYTREDLDAGRMNWPDMTPVDCAEAERKCVEEIIAHGVCTPFEAAYIRKDGSRVNVLVGAAAFDDNPQEGVTFILDLTERNKLEQQFFRAQRMESIGTLAGGIAHDLNNMLTPILLSVQLLKEDVKEPALVECLDTLNESAMRAAALVQQVLSFARGVDGRHVQVDVHHLMDDLLKMMRDTFPKSINVRSTAADDLWMVTGDPTQIHQVFLNLCVNARDAMPLGGSLTISMENVTVDETYAGMNIDSHPGEYVMVKVSDTGTGIPVEVKERMFEPFFTTKEVGKGTGLGLSTVIAILKSQGGFVHVYSEMGEGTKFHVYLPANRKAVEELATTIDVPLMSQGNGELILIVDDEPAIRNVAQSTLERFGYRAMVASNGAEAVAMYAQHGHEIAVVLTDMMMPIMDGPATVVALKAIDPTVKIIGSSGLASSYGIVKASDAGVQHFVPKPYTAEGLLGVLHEVLHPSVTQRT